MVGRSVQVKEDIVEQDPKEHSIRKALNLGHTMMTCFRESCPGRKPSGTAWLCRGVGTCVRTLPLLPQNRLS